MSDVTDDSQFDFESEDEIGEVGAVKAKLAKLREELAKVKAERAEYLDGWQRCKAESVNSRRDAEEARVKAAESGRDSFVQKLLPALDGFAMAMQSEAWQNVDSSWRAGVEGIKSQIDKVMQENGIQSFGSVGDTFDPALHEPIQELPGGEPHTIARVFLRGYRTEKRVIRAAQVAVYA